DAAIATDKRALFTGQSATFANYTSYSRGINGVMVDVRRLANLGSISASDFVFSVGNDNDPSGWGPPPFGPTNVVVRRGAGVDGSSRVEITFPDGSIRNQWLRV